MSERRDFLEILHEARRSASDRRKDFLALYGLLLTLTLSLLVVAGCRALLFRDAAAQAKETFLRPILATTGFFRTAAEGGHWGLVGLALLGILFSAHLVASFFGLAITRMAAIELTGRRRAEVPEALRFARGHWYWRLLTPAALLGAAAAMVLLAALLLLSGRLAGAALLVAAPLALVLVAGAAVVLAGLLAGGILAGPAIATEWSDAFDAVTRVYGYSFGHAYRLFLYRAGGLLMLLVAAATRGLRAAFTLALFVGAAMLGLGVERSRALLDSVLLEAPGRESLPSSLGAWALLASAALFLTIVFARLAVFRLVLHQCIYLLLRLRVDKVPITSIDGYKPDDSAYDPTAQGFELVEVEEEIRAE